MKDINQVKKRSFLNFSTLFFSRRFFLFLFIFSFFGFQLTKAEELEEKFNRHVQSSLIRDIVVDEYKSTNFLNIYRQHYHPETHDQLNQLKKLNYQIFMAPMIEAERLSYMHRRGGEGSWNKSSDADLPALIIKREELHQQLRQNENLWTHMDNSKELPWLKAAALTTSALSLAFPTIQALKWGALALGAADALSTENEEWDHSSIHVQQMNVATLDLIKQFNERKAFREQYSSPDEEGKWITPLNSNWREEGDFVYYKDAVSGEERHFNKGFLNAVEQFDKGKEIINRVGQLSSKSKEDLFDQFSQKSIPYQILLTNEEHEKSIDKLESIVKGLLQNQGKQQERQEKIGESLVQLTKDLSQVQYQVNEQGELLLKIKDRLFAPQSLSEVNEAIKKGENQLRSIEKKLRNPKLDPSEKKSLEKNVQTQKEKLKALEIKQIKEINKKLNMSVGIAGETARFFANAFGADPEVFQKINEFQIALQSSVLIGTSMALLAAGDLTAVFGVFQGLNGLLGQKSGGPNIGELLQQHTEIIVREIRSGIQLVLQNQADIHEDLKRRLEDFESRITTEVKLVGQKVDHVQAYLYAIGDFLNRGIDQIRDDIQRGLLSDLTAQRDIKEAQNKILSRIHSLSDQFDWNDQRSVTQALLNRASGFRRLFEPETQTNLILCREDVNQCMESSKNQMLDMKRLMGELASQITNSLDLSRTAYRFSDLTKEGIHSYLEENQKIRIEDRLHLLPSVGEWLNQHVNENAVEGDLIISNEALESFENLSHPELLALVLDQYIELGNYLPFNELKDPSNPEGRIYIDSGIDALCKASLKHKKATQEMRKAIPLAWEVYKNYLNRIQEIYTELREKYKESFYNTILANEENTSERDITFNPTVKSPLFVEEFSPSIERVSDGNPFSLEREKTVPKDIEVSLRDLLFLPEDKINIFVEGLKEKEWKTLAQKMNAYVRKTGEEENTDVQGEAGEDECKIEEGCLKTSTCEVRKWEASSADHLFPDGKGLTNDFWGPKSFEIVHSFQEMWGGSWHEYEEPFHRESFDCESKGEGHYRILIFVSSKRKRNSLKIFGYEFRGPRDSYDIEYTYKWINYSCKRPTKDFYDEFGNRYSGKTWEIEVYKNSNYLSEETAQSSEKRGSNLCNTCSEKNGNRCSTVNVFENEFDSGRSGQSTLRYHCGWYKPTERQVCKEFIKGRIVVEQTELNKRKLIEELQDLRRDVLTQFKMQIHSIFSGKSVDPQNIDLNESQKNLIQNLSLAKLALTYLIYGGFGRTFIEGPLGSGLRSLIKSLPSGYGPGMTLLKRFPKDEPFSFASYTPAASYAFREWMFLMGQGFLLPNELGLQEIEKMFFITPFEDEEEKVDMTSILGLGRPSYIRDLLVLASLNRNLMMSEECLTGFNLASEPFVIQTQFPYATDSKEKKVELIEFVEENLSFGEEESDVFKAAAIFSFLARDSNSAIRVQAALAAGKLEDEKGLDVLEFLARDSDQEVKSTVLQAVGVLGGRKRAEILKILLESPEVTQEALSLVEQRALKIIGLEGTSGSLVSHASLISNLLQLSASDEDSADEALVFLSIFFNEDDFKPVEERLIRLGLFQLNAKEKEDDFYKFFKNLIELGLKGQKKAIILLDLFFQYLRENQEKRKRMVKLIGDFIGRLGDKRGVLILKQFIHDRNKDVRVLTSEAAGEVNSNESVQALKEILKPLINNKHPQVKIVALESAGKIGDIQTLVEIFSIMSAVDRQNLFYLAIKNIQHPIIVKALIRTKVDINKKNRNGETPLQLAIERNPFVIETLIQAGVDISAEYNQGLNLLNLAVRRSNLPAIEALTRAGIDPNSKTEWRQPSPLRLVIQKHPFDALLFNSLIQAGADPNEKDNNGWTPLYLALKRPNLKAIEALIQAGADSNARDSSGETPLHWAARFRIEPAIIEVLIKAGADVDVKDKRGDTPLHWATRYNKDSAIIKALIKAGADIDAKNKDGRTSLHLAVFYCLKEVITVLIQNGADVRAQNKKGQTYEVIAKNRGCSL